MPAPTASLQVLRGTRHALAVLAGARTLRLGQCFEHSANLEAVDAAGMVRVVNLTSQITGPAQVVVAGSPWPWLLGSPAQVATGQARLVRLDTPVTGPLDPAPAAALAEQARVGSWFCTEQGQKFGLPALARALAGDPAALLGLGSGLTPSGDDVLVAWIGWLRATGGSLAAFTRLSPELPGATTATSATMLEAALDGETSAALNDLLQALAGGEPAAVPRAVRAVAATGSSSGCDALYGLHALWTTNPTSTHTTSTRRPT